MSFESDEIITDPHKYILSQLYAAASVSRDEWVFVKESFFNACFEMTALDSLIAEGLVEREGLNVRLTDAGIRLIVMKELEE